MMIKVTQVKSKVYSHCDFAIIHTIGRTFSYLTTFFLSRLGSILSEIDSSNQLEVFKLFNIENSSNKKSRNKIKTKCQRIKLNFRFQKSNKIDNFWRKECDKLLVPFVRLLFAGSVESGKTEMKTSKVYK